MMKKHGEVPDILVVLLANCATIKSNWIIECLDALLENPGATACVPVIKDNDHHPFRAKGIDDNGFLNSFFNHDKQSISTNRQDLPNSYFIVTTFGC